MRRPPTSRCCIHELGPARSHISTAPADCNSTNASPQHALTRPHIATMLAVCRVLQFLFTEINYGGRVTDDKDRRLMSNLVKNFCSPAVLDEGYAFSPSGAYAVPGCETVAQVSTGVLQLPHAWRKQA